MEIRYYTMLTLAGTVGEELPLYGVYMDKTLNAAGNFTGTFQLGSGLHDDENLLENTKPGLYSLVCEIDNRIVWAGPIWSRTYQSSSETVQLTAQTFESVFEHIVLTSDFVKNNVEQVTIASDLITAVQAQTGCNFGFTTSFPAATGITRTIIMPANENHFASEVLTALQGDDGLNFSFNILGTSSSRTLYAHKTGVPGEIAVYEYPGQISNYWFSESAARGAIRATAVGSGVQATAVSASPGSNPYFTIVEQFTDIVDQALITARADQLLAERPMPSPSPTFELGDVDDFFRNLYQEYLGYKIRVHIEDARFPSVDIVSRMMGWSFSPESSESDANLKFVLETDV